MGGPLGSIHYRVGVTLRKGDRLVRELHKGVGGGGEAPHSKPSAQAMSRTHNARVKVLSTF